MAYFPCQYGSRRMIATILPDSVEEHLVAGRTLNMACGEHFTTRTFSVEKAFDGWSRMSSCTDLAMASLVGAVEVVPAASLIGTST